MGEKCDSRQRLMDAAHELIWGHSYGGVTIEGICQRAKVKKGSFYYYFHSKSDLTISAIDAWWDERRPLMDEIFRPEVPPVERILTYIDFITQRQIRAYEENGQILGCPLFTLGSEICTQDEQLRQHIQKVFGSLVRYFEDAIREAQNTGEVEGTNAAAKARLLCAFYEGSLTRARIENNPALVHNLRADALELIGATQRMRRV